MSLEVAIPSARGSWTKVENPNIEWTLAKLSHTRRYLSGRVLSGICPAGCNIEVLSGGDDRCPLEG